MSYILAVHSPLRNDQHQPQSTLEGTIRRLREPQELTISRLHTDIQPHREMSVFPISRPIDAPSPEAVKYNESIQAAEEAEQQSLYTGALAHYLEAARAARALQEPRLVHLHEANAAVCRSVLATGQADHRSAANHRADAALSYRDAGEVQSAVVAEAFSAHYRAMANNAEGKLDAAVEDRIEAAKCFREAGRANEALISEGLAADCRARIANDKDDLFEARRFREEAARLLRAGDDEDTAQVEDAACADLDARIAMATGRLPEAMEARLRAASLFRAIGQENDAIGEEAFAYDLKALIATSQKEKVVARTEAARLFKLMGDDKNANLELGAAEKARAEDLAIAKNYKAALPHLVDAIDFFRRGNEEQVARQTEGYAEVLKAIIAEHTTKDIGEQIAHRRAAAGIWSKLSGMEAEAKEQLALATQLAAHEAKEVPHVRKRDMFKKLFH